MALCHNCDDVRIEYIGNGSQTDYTFPFEYNERTDVAVAYWNADYQVWEPVAAGWVFLNDTTLRFDPAPETDQKFIIYRCTDLTPLPAEFYPGTAIKAQDLNDNFFVLKSAIEEARCEAQRWSEVSEEKYWNKVPYEEVVAGINPDVGETVYSTDRWVCTDDAVATTQAICDYVEEEIEIRKVVEKDNYEGRWIQNSTNDDDDHFATTAAITDRLDPFFQENTPATSPWRMPGKLWFDNDDATTRIWDQTNQTWVAAGMTGPPGPIGPTGTYQTIVKDTAPTRRVDNSPLINGDVWFNSTTAELFIWYDDGNPAGSRAKQWVQAIGGSGSQGPPGPPGSYTFIQPIVHDTANDEVSFDITPLTTLP
jgi:hypothetical protein